MKFLYGPFFSLRLYALALFVPVAILSFGPACSVQDALARQIFLSSAEYTDREDFAREEFVEHTDRVFSYRYLFYRSLLVRTAAGLVVVDPMNARLAGKLRSELERRFPGTAVHTLFYSHYHRDHVEGGRLLAPRRVVAHANSERYWKDFGEPEEFARPTDWIRGDREYEIGGVRLRLLDLGDSHTDTLYAFHLPDEKLLYSPDVGFARGWPTPGPFHTYYPGYIRAMQRLLRESEWSVWIPAHGETGAREDLADSLEMFMFLRESVAAARAKYPTETRADLERIFEEVWPLWKRRYGHWHGYDQMALASLFRQMAGDSLYY